MAGRSRLSIFPEVLEAIRRQLGIAGRVLNVAMPEVMLDGAGILAVVGELVTRGMPQHVRMDREADRGLFAGSCHDLSHGVRRQRGLAFADEDIGRFRILPLQPAQGPQFRAAERMHRRYPVLPPRHMHQPLQKIHLIPAKRHQFRDPQAMPVGDQDQGRIAKPMPATPNRRGHHRLYFGFGQIFALAIFGIFTARQNFPVFEDWPGVRIGPGSRRIAHGRISTFQFTSEQAVEAALDDAARQALDQLIVREETLSALAAIKQDAKHFGYRMMAMERHKRATLEPWYRRAKAFLPTLGLSQQNLGYYASLAHYYTVYDLRRLKPGQTYLYLLCYAWQRYRQLTDNLVDALGCGPRRTAAGCPGSPTVPP